MRILTGALVLLTVFAALAAAAQDSDSIQLTQVIETEDGFSVSLPADWSQMPRPLLDKVVAAFHTTAGQEQHFEYGFQGSPDTSALKFPMLIVQISRSGPLPPTVLTDMRGFDRGMREGAESAGRKSKVATTNLTTANASYDEKNQVIWTSASSDVQDAGTMKTLMAVKLTSYGTITFLLCAPAKQADDSADLFKAIVTGVELQAAARYDPAAAAAMARQTGNSVTGSPEFRFGRMMGTLFGFCVLLIIAILIFKAIRRLFFRRKGESIPPPPIR